MVTSFVPSVRAVPAGTPLTNVTNTKRGVDSNPQKIKLGEKKFISDEYLRKVCDKIKKKYLRPKTKKLIHQIRKLTTIPSRVHHIILTVFPAKRSGKSGRNRNQSSSSSRPNSQIPIQASDATERDRNRPLVTSTTPVFSTGGSGTPTNPIPTTNLMDLDNERILRDRLRGVGNTVQVAPRYPEYADQIVRQRSFANWPSYTQQQAARLIIFGFYYTGQADLVRCFQCGIGLKDWSPGDEPLFEHVRHSPNCPFLQQLLGDELLGTYRDNLAEAQQRNETATSHGLNIQAPQTRARMMRHPDRATMRQRLDTFTGWPHTNGQPPQRLAEAGLFYTGTNDLCRCFTCDGGLQRWDKDDDPWLEHARWFPHCSYVREVKGQDYINLVLAAAEQAMREDEESVVIQGLQSTDLQTTDPMSTAEARSVIEMGYSKTAVQLAIHEYNGKNPTKGALSFSAADLVQILVGRQERGEEIPQDLPSEELGASGSSQQAATADPMVENRRLKHILKCLTCKENDCNMLLLPCTHHRLCEECAQNVTHCPVCGRKVEDKVRTFMS
ncbi:baculoviral IAP repeat-containing protein 7-like [Dreissena polymorpha]|uniref:baculoviral IAP repeat-containing protein 7-like n=1 Tax=Dreissena polymorpha TaxID=45954 RepID=UPI00226434C2|nr:baculoviral IAP repeat-containing protein 7-like [Dreissena polymorpha]